MQRTPLSTQIRKYPGTLGDLPLALHTKIFQISNQIRSRELWGRLRDAIIQARFIWAWGHKVKSRLWVRSYQAEKYDSLLAEDLDDIQ